ncbi:hypothetical protein [Chitinophaga filiformis]|uniref:Uncharacterized protein n=1 Tax=Chitinophaga filiformis TaxID=104663 RepID=A0A1G7LD35_CHIFI|nr:hypothetical protein [Chitinophaga filiformis]SDF47482.1 hypothetical protein SAMN04488121_10226 [Chitinophaga filiformis]
MTINIAAAIAEAAWLQRQSTINGGYNSQHCTDPGLTIIYVNRKLMATTIGIADSSFS